MYATAFCAQIPHASVSLESGMRISLQLQFEQQENSNYPHTWPKEYSAGIPMDDDDPLYMFLKENVLLFLETLVIPTNRRQPISIKYGSGTHWVNVKFIKRKRSQGKKDLEIAIEEFFDYLKISKAKLDNTKSRIIGGSLGHLLIDYFGISHPTQIRDFRLVYGSSSSGIKIHDDTGHSDGGSKDSITVHMNLFRTIDYIPGYEGSGPWKMSSENIGLEYQQKDDSLCNEFLYVDGYLGERFYRYSKSECRFLERKELMSRNKNIWPQLPKKKLCSVILKEYQDIQLKKNENVFEIFKKHNKVNEKKSPKKTKKV